MPDIKIPKKIKVGGFDYKVFCRGEFNANLEDTNDWGECSGRYREIRLTTNATPQQYRSTFIHETIHAVNQVYVNNELTEFQITLLTNGLFQVLEQLGVRFVN
jgi:hypothetical protein